LTLLTFTEHALPYCVFSRGTDSPRVGAALGTYIIDLHRTFGDPIFAGPSLNAFMNRGPRAWQRTRERLLGSIRGGQIGELVPIAEATLHLPFEVADFADFYSSLEHATNAARILRPGDPQLHRNWREMPVGYHGRSGTVVVSGTPVTRPRGQLAPGHARPELAPTRRLDFEAEIGFVVGAGSAPGQPVPAGSFAEHVFGVVLLIDWSARDIQAFESRPLGPFLGKSFATTISPWVIPLSSLEQARVTSPAQDPEPLGYLRDGQPWGLDIDLTVSINGQVISRPRFATMYWTGAQQLAHLTVNGAALRTGDLYGSGTVSSFRREEMGSLLEMTAGGRDPLTLLDGQTRAYLADGDTVTLSGSAPGPGGSRIDFGSASGQIISQAGG
jgi:fumarylacetoacetase